MYPLLFALLPGKTQGVYTQLLTKLKTSMADLQLQLAPTTIFMNFETAAQNAARIVFSGITVKGCFFHYTPAIWGKPNTLVYMSPTETTRTFDNLQEEQLLFYHSYRWI